MASVTALIATVPPRRYKHLRAAIPASESIHVVVDFELASAVGAIEINEVFGHGGLSSTPADLPDRSISDRDIPKCSCRQLQKQGVRLCDDGTAWRTPGRACLQRSG